MALAGILSYAPILLVLAMSCSDRNPKQATAANAAQSDTGRVSQSGSVARDIVLRARAFDRADQLDSARILYALAATKAPAVRDWLHLRAAGVSTEKSVRDDYLDKIELPIALDRRAATVAIALERGGDIDAAVVAYRAAGDPFSALRLGLVRPADSARVTEVRRGIIALLARGASRDATRDAIALFDKTFTSRSADEELVIARAAYAIGLASRSTAGFRVVFASAVGESTDRFSNGLMLARLNRDTEAAAEYARVTGPAVLIASARYQRARALLALGRRSQARTALRQITTEFPSDTSAASSLLLLSDLATDDLRDADARSTLLTVVKRFPQSRHAPSALFRAAIAAYANASYRVAAAEFDSIVKLYPTAGDAVAAGYWSGRAWKQVGDTTNANARWRAVIAREPASYYSVLSAKRLGRTLLGDSSEVVSAYPVVDDVVAASGRIALLKDFGMDTEAQFEYDRLFRDAGTTPQRLVATAHALTGTDQSSRSMALGRRAVDEVGRTAENYRLVYPVLEREALIRFSQANGLDPVLVASLIRQESSFNPRATSPVGARGLMQLMPSVGRTLAQSQGLRGYTDDSLWDPTVSIQLGTRHLQSLFRGGRSIERVLAAYNAGESRVLRWSRKTGTDDPEMFTERIPFVETRDYVRIILRNRAFYSALYQW